nr:hypothetical protein B0A51_13251 [Rachicladosporium sp. CCFEE 5018]
MAATPFVPTANMQPTNNTSPPQSFYPNTPPSINTSPIGYYTHLHVRQLRTPKQPLYTPACLRPTEPLNSRPKDIPIGPRAPDTPPRSKESSFDSAKSGSLGLYPGSPRVMSPDEDMPSALHRGLSRAGSEMVEEEQGEVSGAPTTAHWKPNESALACAICLATFTWYFRKHHCRHCGDVVCAPHLVHTVPLDQNARYHTGGAPSKACDTCYCEWRMIKKLRHSRSNSVADSLSSQGTAKPPMNIPQGSRLGADMHVGSMARSEGGMVWSTF